jgi:hypothetical protein
MNYELKQYSFGDTIGKGFNLYFDNFVFVVLVSLLCQVPTVLFIRLTKFIKASSDPSSIGAGYFGQLMVMIVLSIIEQGFLSAFIIDWISKKFLESSPAIGKNRITSILPLILPAIGVSAVVGMAIVFGFLPFIIPGIVIWLGFSLANVVLVTERRKIGESMTRSWILTKGRKGTMFLFILVTMLITVGITQVVLLLLRLGHLGTELIKYLEYAITAIVDPIQYCIMVVVYFNMRIEKEAFHIEHLAEQFTLADAPELSVKI